MMRTLLLVAVTLAACSHPHRSFGDDRSPGTSSVAQRAPTLPGETRSAAQDGPGKKRGGEHPEAAARQRLSERLDENGQIPFDALMKAKAQRDAVAPPEGDGGLDRGSWRWLGPANIGGRCRALYVHPGNANRMVLASATGGLWLSTDAGQRWTPVNDFLPSLTVCTLAAHPTQPDVIYAGTGETYTGAAGAGIFRSTDLGSTWTRLASTVNSNFEYVSKIVIHPTIPGTLLAATRTGIWRSVNAGVSWSRVRTPASGEWFYDLEWHVLDPNRVVAGSNQAAYYSPDGGTNWLVAGGLPAGVRRVELGVSASSRTTVWACVFVSPNQTYVMRSSTSGLSYIEIPANRSLGGSQGDYNNTVWVSPLTGQHVVIGGVSMIRTLNNGSTWESIQGSVHPDVHAVVSHATYNGTSNKTVWVCCDGGVYRGSDILAAPASIGWTGLNQNLGITQFHGGAISANGSVFGGTQDNGSVISEGNNRVTFVGFYGFDGGDCAADSTDRSYMYGESQFAGVFRYNGLFPPFRFDPPEAGGAAGGPFIAPLVLDPNDDRRLYSGQWQVFVCDPKAGSPVWRSVAPNRSAHVTAIAVTPGNSNIVYVGYGSGQIWKSTNATATTPTWTRISASPLPARVPTKIAVHPRNPSRVYVSFGGYAANNVAYSSNGGATWSLRGGSGASALPAAPIRSVAAHPLTDDWIYAGTELGVFVSTNNGLTWSTDDEGPAAVDISELIFRGSDLYAFTYGRGIYTAHASPPEDPLSSNYRASLGVFDVEGNSTSQNASLSDDARLVAFSSFATNLVAGDTNGAEDVFVRDRQAGTTERMSVGAASGTGFIQGNGASSRPEMARAGRYLAFESAASNLMTGDTNGVRDIFVRDMQGRVTEMVSKWGATSYLPGQGNGHSSSPSISADGRYVAFVSSATNLVNGAGNDTNMVEDVFVRDRHLEALVRVSVSDTGAQANGASRISSRAISDDGNFVVFVSIANNLVTGDSNGVQDVFVRDRANNRTTRVSVSSSGIQADSPSESASISGDGRWVAFSSLASNLSPGDSNAALDIFVHDRVTRVTQRITTTPANHIPNSDSWNPIISADGAFVMFRSDATDLVAGDTNSFTDVFLTTNPPSTATTRLMSRTFRGTFPIGASFVGDLSADGTQVAFHSNAADLVHDDTNSATDVFVHRRLVTDLTLPTARAATEGSTSTPIPFGSSAGRLQQAARQSKGVALQFDRIAFRRDRIASSAAFARTVDLELRVGATDIDAMQSTFASNFVGSPTLALSRRNVSLPDWRVSVAGLSGFDAVIPLEVPYVHDGARHLLWDMSIYGSSNSGGYIADADDGLASLSSTGDVVGAGCSSFRLASGYATNGLSSDLTLTVSGAPQTQPVTFLLGIADPMLSLPGFCTTVRVTPLISTGIGTTGSNGGMLTTLPLGPYDPALGGTVLRMQVLAPDPTRTPVPVSLSNGLVHTIPSGSPGPLLRRLWATSASASVGTLENEGAVFRLER